MIVAVAGAGGGGVIIRICSGLFSSLHSYTSPVTRGFLGMMLNNPDILSVQTDNKGQPDKRIGWWKR
jgi:hypothetical protein